MLRKVSLGFAIVLCLASVSQAATSIVVGNHILQPNMPNQLIQIFVTGGDQIQGVNLNAQIGPDPSSAITPVFQFDPNQHLAFPGPNLSTLLAPGSIFAPPAGFGENDVTFYPRLWQSGSATSSGTVAANGLLATLYIDTTGLIGGVWPLILSATIAGPTDWAGSIFQGQEVSNPIIIDGTIGGLIPEPSSIVLAGFAVIGFGGFVARRRRAGALAG